MEKRERSKDEIPFSEMTSKQKVSYLWDYWRMPALVVIVAVVLIALVIQSMTSGVEPLLCVTTVDSFGDESLNPVIKEYAAQAGISEEQLRIGDTVVGTAKNGGGSGSGQGMAFYVRLQAGDEDIVILRNENFEDYGSSGYFMDLTDIVPENWQDKLIVVEQKYDEFDKIQPEPIACGIRAADIPGIPKTPFYEDAILTISSNPGHYEEAAGCFRYILNCAQ